MNYGEHRLLVQQDNSTAVYRFSCSTMDNKSFVLKAGERVVQPEAE